MTPSPRQAGIAFCSILAFTLPAAAQLTTDGNQVWAQGLDNTPGQAESGEAFGAELAAGDFNGDEIFDLAVGVPGDNNGNNRGAVNVYYGADAGLSPLGAQEWKQGGDLGGNDERGDNFGFALAAGDFNGDGFDDLAVGVPGEDNAQGSVQIILGSSSGLRSQGAQVWDQDDDLEGDGRDANDLFGYDLAAGDFNGDGYADLAVGAPGENNSGGLVNVLFGSSGGLSATGNQRWRQGADDIQGGREDGDFFGGTLAAGDTNGDGLDELIISSIGENNGEGVIHVLFGNRGGLVSTNHKRWRQEDGLPDERERGDLFGSTLATGDFNNDGYDDIAVSSLGENDGAGVVIIIPGSADGSTSTGSYRLRQEDPAAGDLGDRREDGDRFGSGLAAGDFNLDGFEDLGIGVRGEDDNNGIVHVVYGAAGGLSGDGAQIFAQGFDGAQGQAQNGDSFGSILAAADVGADFADDLIVSSPGEDNGRSFGLVHVFFGVQPINPTISQVVGAGLSQPFVTALSPNALATVFGMNLFPEGFQRVLTSDDLVDGRVPTKLDDVCVEMNGLRTPLFFLRGDQINFQARTTPGQTSAQVQVIRNCDRGDEVRSNSFEVTIAPASPEFFYFVGVEDGPNPIAARENSTGALVGPPALFPNAGFAPARPGDIVNLFLTGLGDTTPGFSAGEIPTAAARSVRNVRLLLGDVEVEVLYAGVSPGFAGLYQATFMVPANAPIGDVRVTLISEGPSGDIQSAADAYLIIAPPQ